MIQIIHGKLKCRFIPAFWPLKFSWLHVLAKIWRNPKTCIWQHILPIIMRCANYFSIHISHINTLFPNFIFSLDALKFHNYPLQASKYFWITRNICWTSSRQYYLGPFKLLISTYSTLQRPKNPEVGDCGIRSTSTYCYVSLLLYI